MAEMEKKADLICVKCGIPLVPAKTTLTYLGHVFHTDLPRCKICGQFYISEELAKTRISEVEAELEDK